MSHHHQDPALAPREPWFRGESFVSQYDDVEDWYLEKETANEIYSVQRAFDSQLCEVEDLLDANAKLMGAYTLAADDETLCSDGEASSEVCSCCEPRDRRWSGTSAGSDIFDEDGIIRSRVVERWMGGEKGSSRSEAKFTRRGVDCRLDMGDRVCEWVIWL